MLQKETGHDLEDVIWREEEKQRPCINGWNGQQDWERAGQTERAHQRH